MSALASPMSTEARILLKLLDDGRWHDYTAVRVRLAATVAPGKALRRYDTNEASRVARRGPRIGPQLSDEEKILSGQASIATDVMHSMRKHHIDVRDLDGTRQVRRRPALVAPPEEVDDASEAERVEPGSPLAAFFSEEQVRDMIHDELCGVLDDFQDGLADYLAERFADIEAAIRTLGARLRPPSAPPAAIHDGRPRHERRRR